MCNIEIKRYDIRCQNDAHSIHGLPAYSVVDPFYSHKHRNLIKSQMIFSSSIRFAWCFAHHIYYLILLCSPCVPISFWPFVSCFILFNADAYWQHAIGRITRNIFSLGFMHFHFIRSARKYTYKNLWTVNWAKLREVFENLASNVPIKNSCTIFSMFGPCYGCQWLFSAISNFIYAIKMWWPSVLDNVNPFDSHFNTN